MRVFLAISVILHITLAQKPGINVPCNKELDGLLTTDPDGDEHAFLSCQSVGVGSLGFWERKLCPNNLIFDFINQQCKTASKKARKQQTLNIAILNNSCANGETCIGGSVCDLDSLKCMCPYGTTPKLETLSCESTQPSFVSATIDGPSHFFNSLSGANGNRNNNGYQPTFGQSHEIPDFQPNNNAFKFNNFGSQNSNNNQQMNNNNNNNKNFNWNPNFSWQNTMKPTTMNNNMNTETPSTTSTEFNGFQPNPNQKFVFNFKNLNGNGNNNNKNINQLPVPEVKPKVATLAIPGASCKSNEICVGGSICTLPIGICLCPGDLEARDGECVLPAASTISVSKVGIGALCSDLAECDHGSTCLMGRCTCVSPLIQHEGKCVLRQQQKVVGPGELCDNGEICGKGSICDIMIPVCVCPANTDLNSGECVQVTAPVTLSMMTPPPTLPPVPVQTAPPATQPPPPPPPTMPTRPQTYPTIKQTVFYQTTPSPAVYTTFSTTQYVPKHIYTAPPQAKPSVKINQMKIGGSKQAGVGVRCSLNTDCMIGAYCNGNTNPPSCQCLSTHVNIEGRCEKVIYPGQVGCRSDLQCHAAYTGTHCIDRICVCPEGQKAVDQTCVSGTSLPNQTCGFSETNPCSGQSVCFKNFCTCPDRYFFNPSSSICEVYNPEHSACSKACDLPRSCIRNACVCPDNVDCSVKVTEKRVVRRQATNEVCTPTSDICSSRNAVCIDEMCQCLKGHREQNGVCVSNFADNTSKACSKNEECADKCYCQSGKCECDVPTTCDSSLACPVHWICEEGKCKCESDEFDINKNCLPSSHGAFKNINNQCSSKDRCSGGSKCKDDLCQCVDGSVELTGKCKQFPAGHCSNGEMCSGGSYCYLGICRCEPSRTLDNQRCVLTTVPIGAACRKGQKCINGAACRFGMCMCVAKSVAVLGRCVPNAEAVSTSVRGASILNKNIGMPCSPNDVCLGGSSCIEGVCLCDPDSETLFDKCVTREIETTSVLETTTPRKIIVGETCEEKDECSSNSTCVDGVCTCMNGFKQVDEICEQQDKMTFFSRHSKATPGSFCNSSSECVFRTKCLEGVCRCKKGKTIIDSTCRSAIHHVLPGSTCDPMNGYDCVGESICIYGVCKCRTHLISDGEKCVPENVALQVAPGKSCSNGEPCGGGSSCSQDRICRCPADHVTDVNKKCVKKKNVLAVFNKKPEETTPFIMTTTTTIGPTIDYTNFETKLNEIEQIELELKNSIPLESPIKKTSTTILSGHICQQNTECPAFAFCFANVCHCMAGFKASSGICEAAILSGDACITSNQCVDNTECVFGRCMCIPTIDKPCTDTKMARPGEDCTASKTICSFNSYCSLMSNVCECPSGMATKGKICENTFESIGKDCVTSRNCQKSSYCDNGYCVCKTGNVLEHNICLTNENNSKQSFSIRPFEKNVGENTPLQNLMKNEFTGLQHIANDGLFETTTKWPELLSFTVPSLPITAQNFNFPQAFSSFPIAYGAKTVAEEENNSTIKYKMSFPGEYCGQGEVCLGNSVCKQQFCRCLQDVTAENGICPPQIDDLSLLGLHPLSKEVRFQSPSNRGMKPEMKRDAVYPLENCQNDEKCLNNSTCQSIGGIGKICQCVEDTVYMDGDCVRIEEEIELVPIDGICHEDTICLSGSQCKDSKCACGEEKHLILGICLQTANPDESCENGEICINGSVCGESLCECPEGSEAENGNCLGLSEEESSTESESLEEDTNFLRKLVRRELTTAECVTDSQCSPNFQCLNFMCTCDENSEECLKSLTSSETILVPPGSGCNNYRKCGNDSICYKDYCVCSYEDMPKDDRCVSRDYNIGIGSPCTNTTRCRDDLKCVAGICMCKFGDFECNPSEPVTSPPGGSCSGLRECTGGSVCKEGWCICPDTNMIVNKGICIQSGPRPTLPPRTTIPVVLQPATVQVPHFTITKSQPFVTEPPQGKKIVPGGRCGPLDACVGGSSCIEGHCLCPAGMHPSSNGRCEKYTTLPTTRLTTPPPSQPGTTPTPQSTSVLTSAFTVADLFTTRRQPAFIEIPTHDPLTTTVAVQKTTDDCTELGLICKGNTICINKSCQCPDGYVLHHDGCVSPEEAAKRRARQKARHEAATNRVYSKPGESCINDQNCVGGSNCSSRKICECPSERPEIVNGQCSTPKRVEVVPGASCNENSVCIRGSSCENGLCRCQPGYIAVSGNCVALPMSTTPRMRTIAKPFESCENGEICDGGSSCDMDTGICMCPPGQIVFNVQCMPPPTQKLVTQKLTTSPIRTTLTSAKPTFATDCEKDSNCSENKICVTGKCKCKPGFVDNSGVCEPLEDIDVIERPIPVSYAKHKVVTLSERMQPKEEIEVSNIEPETTTTTTRRPTPAMQETQKPRIVGPPIRRPKPKNKSGGGSSGGSGGSGGSRSYKTGSGNGNCPPGNDPTRDDSGKLVICNGLEPNCPPRSYCYITSGGFATEEYNCCKSW